jgi:acetyl-CoA synthetase
VLPATCPASRPITNSCPQPGDLLWTPADWAWAGGLLNVLFPALYFGVPVVALPSRASLRRRMGAFR